MCIRDSLVPKAAQSRNQLFDMDGLSVLGTDAMVIKDLHEALALFADSPSSSIRWAANILL